MIYDCITFFNELEILELRLNILADYVDKFVIVEANKTHTGGDKEFILEKNFERFEKFKDKITYIKIEEFPPLKKDDEDSFGNNWLYENFQRDEIMKGLKDCKNDDIIFVSDCDEIWNPDVLKEYKEGICSLKLYNCYYNYNTVDLYSFYTKKVKVCRYKDLIDPKQDLKGIEYCAHSKYGLPTYLRFCKGKNIYNGGWHFSYINDIKNIILKRKSIVEQQYNTLENMDEEKIRENIEKGRDILDHGGKYINISPKGFLPKYMIDNIEKYEKFINKKNNIPKSLVFIPLFWSKLYSDRIYDTERVIKIFGIKFKMRVK